MKRTLLFFLLLSFAASLRLVAQGSNIITTNPVAEQILLGNYDPADYAQAAPIAAPDLIASGLEAEISPDSLKAYIIRLSEFGNRNTGSDTVSGTFGIGAARRWVYQKFEEFSAASEDRLVVTYLQFDQSICSVGQHRNIAAILPGTDPANNGVIIIEGHIDSRCEGLCDVTCLAEGVEDNASGTALVMEAARVMAQFSFKNTIIFTAVIAEEQGLYGAEAWADYIQAKNIPLRAVLNNDVIGGVICGETSSPPSCPGLNDVDSTSVRLFSAGGFNSRHKQLARYTKLEYHEMLLPTATVPMNVRIMSPEDRTGRGGDHIPFREHGYPAIRFTAANEHGNADVSDPNYDDRQHTSDDVLGVDTDGDGAVDSFFVQFHYLARNTLLNANAAAMIAQNVATPTNFTATRAGDQLSVSIEGGAAINRVAIRTATNEWDTVFTVTGASGTFTTPPAGPLFVSVAAVDGNGIESLFSGEKLLTPTSATGEPLSSALRLLQNRPNPFDEATWISFWAPEALAGRGVTIQISDLNGKIVQTLPVTVQPGLNEVLYTHGYGVRGTFTYTLLLEKKVVDARQMIFAY
jgi:hypothetical protein